MVRELIPNDFLTGLNEAEFNDLYERELADHDGPEKGGACMRNAARLARLFEKRGLDPKKIHLLYIVAPTPMGPDSIRPNTHALREEEVTGKPKKEWSYHTAILVNDTAVYDLSSQKKYLGMNLRKYMETLFLDDKGNAPHNLRFITVPLTALYEMADERKTIQLDELIRQGKEVGKGMSSIWMLQNRPESEWYFR